MQQHICKLDEGLLRPRLISSSLVFFNINALIATSSDEPDMEMAAISGRSTKAKSG